MHEAELYEDNCSLTLTYDDAHLPDDYSVHPREFQLFMKRLRKEISPRKVRFFHCGEYGEKNLRPHYHALLFNWDFPDKVPHKKTPQGHMLYSSALLDRLWGLGHALIGDVTFESAAYAARYILKKVTGDAADEAYERVHPLTGEVCRVHPEYVTMSRRPGLGTGWALKYKDDLYPSDFVIVRGRRMKPPKFYDNLLNDQQKENVKRKRTRDAAKHKDNQTPERLKTREALTNARVNEKLPRKL